MIRQLIQQVILEDLEGFKARTAEISYDHRAPKDIPRFLKQAWAAEADRTFFESVIKVHWIAGLPKSHYAIFKKMNAFLNASGRDEIATMGYIDRPNISQWGEFGVMVQGRTTLAAKDMNAIHSGYYRDMDPEEIEKYRKTSGIPRRARSFNRLTADGYVLDEKSFGTQYLGNELIVDNWESVGLIAPLWFLNSLKKDVLLLGKRKLSPDYEDLVRLFVTTELPVYSTNGNKKDMSPLRQSLEVM